MDINVNTFILTLRHNDDSIKDGLKVFETKYSYMKDRIIKGEIEYIITELFDKMKNEVLKMYEKGELI